MPVPTRDDGSPGPTRRLIVFVHGFRSSAATWAPLRRLLEEDPSITSEFDLGFFDYATALAAVPVIRTLPTLDTCGKALAARLKADLAGPDGQDRYIDVTLVGHSMGGLIIQSCLLNLLTPDGAARVLDRIRQVMLFATPNFGSTTLGALRRVLSIVIDNPQERALRLFSEESVRIHEAIRDRVIFARRRGRDEYPIPFYCFSGATDGIVRPESALGHFAAGEPLPGDHFAVHAPRLAADPAYRQFVQALRHPHGHANVWEVEQFSTSIRIAPADPGSEVLARYGGKERTVHHDNVASIVRKVVFSANNRCREPYVLKYGTRNGGWVVPRISEPHITTADKLRLYDDNGVDAYFEVEPTPGSTARLDLTVYKGFDEGHRDYHMHLGRSTSFRRVSFEVDLSAYRSAGWRLIDPQLYFHHVDAGDHKLCAQRAMGFPDPPASVDAAGVWTWTLEFVKEGVIDLVWDVQPPSPQEANSETTIQLAAGQHAVFGYGSLLSVESLERTLGRRYDGPFHVCTLHGWRRRWNVAMPNDAFAYRDGGQWITPPHIFYLNVEPADGAPLNGTLFVVDSAELASLDAREWIYDRAEVGSQLGGVTVTGGPAWVYRGKTEHVRPHPSSPRDGAVRRSYLTILEEAHRALGSVFVRGYQSTTDAVPRPLVIDDVRRNEL